MPSSTIVIVWGVSLALSPIPIWTIPSLQPHITSCLPGINLKGLFLLWEGSNFFPSPSIPVLCTTQVWPCFGKVAHLWGRWSPLALSRLQWQGMLGEQVSHMDREQTWRWFPGSRPMLIFQSSSCLFFLCSVV